MKSVSISGSPRENVGKKDAKALRNQGSIPCVLYGGKEQVHFSADEKELKKIVYNPNTYSVDLNIGGNKYNAIMQDIQFHPVSDKMLHVDFKEIIPGKPLITYLPVRNHGVPKGVLSGGRLITNYRKVKVKALPEHMPDGIDLEIEDLDIGDSIKVSDLKVENVTFLDTKTDLVTGVRVTRIVVEETPVEAVVEGAVEGAVPGAPGAPGAPGVPITPGAPGAAAPGARGAAPGAPGAAPGAATPPPAADKDKGKDKGKGKK
ncbi:MAG: 50S ribosomal protein L25/general stress protein Ctc [Bacteroidales bacterium]|nr:50S ribosomal protein L25/general stress protein Ctc [Bacteroidales bacterium]